MFLFAAPAAEAAGSEFFGLVQGPPLDETDFQSIPATGVKTARFLLPWMKIEKNRGELDWSAMDEMVGGLASHGIQPVPFAFGSPPWTGAGGQGHPPLNSGSARRAWEGFLKAAVDRYGPGGSYWTNGYRQQYGEAAVPLPIRSWQIWNEPNVKLVFDPGATAEHAAQLYAQLVRVSHDAITSEDPQAKIVTAGIITQKDPEVFDFLDSFYSVPGIKDDFDAMAQHAYAPSVDQVRDAIKGVRKVMAHHGDQATPLWITEIGWGSAPPEGDGINLGPEGQADMLTRSFRLILNHRSTWNVQRLYWFHWRDPVPGTHYEEICGRCGSAGLLTYDRTPKPAYDAFVAFTAETTPPSTSITAGPSGTTNHPTPTFGFSSSEAGSSFECKLDSGPYAACASPKTTANLVNGSHTFSVRATDAAGNTDPTPAARTFRVQAASVSVSGSTLLVSAGAGSSDNLAVGRPSASTLRVTDLPSGAYTGSGLRVGTGCTRSGDYTANCKAAGITEIRVTAGDRADRVVNHTGIESSLFGGGASDTLVGGWNKDSLTGGPAADVVEGMDGNDLLQAQDGTSDNSVDCGAGSDKADLDLLPKDPDSVVSGCETKSRQ